MNELMGTEVINSNGIICTHSTIIADRFKKEHKNVTRDIENVILQMRYAQNCPYPENVTIESIPVEEYNKYFIRWDIKDNSNRLRKGYAMTKDGFSLLVMGFTGAKALEFKVKFLDAFNAMESALRNQVPQISEKDILTLKLFSKDAAEVAKAHKQLVELEVVGAIAPLVETIEVQKPKAEFYDNINQMDIEYSIADVAKTLDYKGVGRNILHKILKENNILDFNGKPYARYAKYFRLKLIDNKYSSSITLVKGSSGVDFIRRQLEKLGYEKNMVA